MLSFATNSNPYSKESFSTLILSESERGSRPPFAICDWQLPIGYPSARDSLRTPATYK